MATMFSNFIAATADFPEALPPHCEPTSEFLRNISIWFGACFPSNLSLASNVFGCMSIIAWLFAQLPQIVKNHRRKSVDGLSPTFLGNWLLGDVCNLTGAVMTNQMWFQQVIGVYYVLVDVALCMQYVWYSQLKPECMKRKGLGGSDAVLDDDLEVVDGVSVCDSCSTCSRSRHNSYSGSKKERRASSMNLPSGRSVLAAMTLGSKLADALPIGGEVVNATSFGLDKQVVGNTIAWISAFMYLTSRIPQLLKNYRRKSCAGLSIYLFVAAFCGNLFYSLSLLSNPLGMADYPAYGGGGIAGPDGSSADAWWNDALPFFLGASGVLGMDATIGIQYLLWGEKTPVEDEHLTDIIEPVNETTRLLA